MSNKSINTVKTAIGITFISSTLAIPLTAFADSNPFVANDLGSGYQLAGKDAEGKCGESKTEAEGKCGEKKAETEGKCGGSKAESEGKCGETKTTKAEGKCGEGKCGENK